MRKLNKDELANIASMNDNASLFAKLALLRVIPELFHNNTVKVGEALAALGYTNEEMDNVGMHWHSNGGVLPGGGHHEHLKNIVEKNGESFCYLTKGLDVKRSGKDLNTALKLQYILHQTLFG